MTLPPSMEEVLRRTRAGDLVAATAMIRSSLRRNAAPWPLEEQGTAVVNPIKAQVAPKPPIGQSAPACGRFEARRHLGPCGRMDYMLYRPAAARPGMPLVVMLHGCTQTPEDFARGTGMNRLADEIGFLVAYPRQTTAANAQKCWNWFRPGDQERGRGEPALIADVTRDVVEAEQADAARVFVAGLSAGGAAAAIMANAYPDLFAAVGVHSGLACGAARDLPGALAAMKRGGANDGRCRAVSSSAPLIIFHGDRDGTVHEINAHELVAAATAASGSLLEVALERGEAGGRRYARAVSRDFAGRVLIEHWTIAGADHAWSGGDPAGSYADRAGPNASREMLRFFLEQKHADR